MQFYKNGMENMVQSKTCTAVMYMKQFKLQALPLPAITQKN